MSNTSPFLEVCIVAFMVYLVSLLLRRVDG
jgi:hypothetical protein